ncbi:MAG: hypothetical protein LBG46_02560 [Elusimicrobiota bacterium]|jgi:hypothetical protein|nr:hypothetical protein [Elusimicrobiota bacterium]
MILTRMDTLFDKTAEMMINMQFQQNPGLAPSFTENICAMKDGAQATLPHCMDTEV